MSFYNLTKPQHLIYEMEKYIGGSIANIVGGIICSGIEVAILERAIKAIIKNNDALRIRLSEQEHDTLQYVCDYIEYEVANIIHFKSFETKDEMDEFFREWGKEPFDISGPLCAFYIVSVGGKNGCIAKLHHIISDAWTILLIGSEIFKYAHLYRQESEPCTKNPSYLEYIAKEQLYRDSSKYKSDREYWLNQFKAYPEAVYISDKREVSFSSNRVSYCVNGKVVKAIKEYSRQTGFSVYSLFMAAAGIYLSSIKGKEQFYLGTAILNRSGRSEKGTIGMFVNTAAVLMTIHPSESFNEVVKKTISKSADVFRHQKYQYGEVLKDLRQQYQFSEKLYDVMVSYQNAKIKDERDFETTWYPCGMQCESLEMHISDRDSTGELMLDYDYQVCKFCTKEIEQLHSHILNIICKGIKNNPQISTINMLSAEAFKKIIYETNKKDVWYPKDKTIAQLFKEQVEKTPQNIAIEFEGQKITYTELDKASTSLAKYLVGKGVGPEKIVSIFLPRSPELMVSILGVLKAGGAYLPIDASYACERVNYMLEDSGSQILITNDMLKEELTFSGEIITKINHNDTDNATEIALYTAQAHNLIYVIYTSGSTGYPKGVMLSNRSVVNYILWASKNYLKGESLSFALFTSIAFDLTVTSLFTPLITGNSLIIYGDTLGASAILEVIKDNKSEIVKLTPSHLKVVMNMDNSHSKIRRFILGGEQLECVCAQKTLDSFKGKVEIYNEYGPTEATVGCMIHKYDPQKDKQHAVPIGIPADNVKLYLLDKNLNPVGAFNKGELYIAGDGVARGYIGKKELTEKSFVDNPFEPGLMYKTGDRAVWTEQFVMSFCGRSDEQVKIRGHRIELLEIESKLMQIPRVKQAIVVAPQKDNGERYLCTYYLSDNEIEIQVFYSFLKKYLPEYMIPAYYVRLDLLPVTSNGKIDKSALPAVDFTALQDLYVPPKNALETTVLATFQEVLGITQIGMKDSFFALGGDSIKAIQIVSRLGNVGITLDSKDILSQDILQQIVLCAKESLGIRYSQELAKGSIEDTPIIRWFQSKGFKCSEYYCQTIVLRMDKDTDIEALNKSFDKLIEHFDILRMNRNETGFYYNNALLEESFCTNVFDLKELTSQKQDLEFKKICIDMKKGLSLDNALPIKAGLFYLTEETALVITAHHLVTDGVTWRLLAENLKNMYSSIINGSEPKLSTKTASYAEWGAYLKLYAQTAKVKNDAPFWNSMQRLERSLNNAKNLSLSQEVLTLLIKGELDEEYTHKLLYSANAAYNTSIEDLIVCAVMLALREWTGYKHQTIEMEGHGRGAEGIDVSSTAGWFTAIYPVSLTIESIEIGCQIIEIKEQLHQILDGGIAYGILKYFTDTLEEMESPEIRFNYLGVIDHPDYILRDTGQESAAENTNRPKLDINCMIAKGKFIAQLDWQATLFTSKAIEEFKELFISYLKNIINFTISKKEAEFTASDFSITQGDFHELFA